jgi:hypothetical protein
LHGKRHPVIVRVHDDQGRPRSTYSEDIIMASSAMRWENPISLS